MSRKDFITRVLYLTPTAGLWQMRYIYRFISAVCPPAQSKIWAGKLKQGDVIFSNHPEFGGTHLPDINVITPAFNGNNIIFYVASRAHHGLSNPIYLQVPELTFFVKANY